MGSYSAGATVTDYFCIVCTGCSLQSDPLTVLLAKYIPDPDRRPRRDVSGDYSQSNFQTLTVGSFSGVFRKKKKEQEKGEYISDEVPLPLCMKDDQQLESSR